MLSRRGKLLVLVCLSGLLLGNSSSCRSSGTRQISRTPQYVDNFGSEYGLSTPQAKAILSDVAQQADMPEPQAANAAISAADSTDTRISTLLDEWEAAARTRVKRVSLETIIASTFCAEFVKATQTGQPPDEESVYRSAYSNAVQSVGANIAKAYVDAVWNAGRIRSFVTFVQTLMSRDEDQISLLVWQRIYCG